MDARQAARDLEVIRTLMERTCQYQLLTARAGLAAGSLAVAGSVLLSLGDWSGPTSFGVVWGLVFLGSLLATALGTLARGRQRGERVWSRQARAVVRALAPSLLAAGVLSVFFFARGMYLWLPGVWMLCYGQGALATAAYAPRPICWLGMAFLALGALTLGLGPDWAVLMMGLAFGLGHLGLGGALLVAERRQGAVRLQRFVA
jgi:hypothetical protein